MVKGMGKGEGIVNETYKTKRPKIIDLRLKSNMNRGSANQRISVSTDPHRGTERVISGRNQRPRS